MCFFHERTERGNSRVDHYLVSLYKSDLPDTWISQSVTETLQSLGVMDLSAHMLKCSLKMAAGQWKRSSTLFKDRNACVCLCLYMNDSPLCLSLQLQCSSSCAYSNKYRADHDTN